MIQILILVELFIDVSAFLKMFGTTFMVVHLKLLFLKKLSAQSMIQKMFGKVLIAGRKLVKLQSPYHCFISLLYSVVLFHYFMPLFYSIVLFYSFILLSYSVIVSHWKKHQWMMTSRLISFCFIFFGFFSWPKRLWETF